jgi:hypothetical protein
MNNLLSKLLLKRGVTRNDLDEPEKKDFDRWEKILSEGDVTVESIGNFCKAQISAIEAKWKDFDNTNERLVIAHTIYSTIIKALTANKVERESLEEYLNNLIQ